MEGKRNTTLSICKGIGIILMVIGHARCPGRLCAFIYMFHMPLFFIASGYFFATKYTHSKWTFFKKKVRGLYLPFVEWSLIFLALHNILVLSKLEYQEGNTFMHPYNWATTWMLAKSIVLKMGGYDQMMLATFWFLRSLFVGNIVFCFLFFLINKFVKSELKTALVICILAFAGGLALSWNQTDIPYIPQGGAREIYAIFYIGVGFIFHRLPLNECGNKDKWLLAGSFTFVLIYSIVHPTTLRFCPDTVLYLNTFLPGMVGFIMVYKASQYIDSHPSFLQRMLKYTGCHTLSILTLSMLSFKVVNLIKIAVFQLPIGRIGDFPVINIYNDFFWILYSAVGVALPLILATVYLRLKRNFIHLKK